MASGSATAVFNAINTNVTAAMWAHTASTAVITSLSILPLDGTSATAVTATGGTSKWTGTGVSEVNIAPAVMLKLQTGFRGPAARGRSYLPFPTEALASAGSLVSTTQTSMQTAWNSYWTAMQASTCFPVVASYVHRNSKNVTSYFVEPLLGTQRRRQQRLRKI